LSDVGFLSGCTGLESVNLDFSPVVDIAPLSGSYTALKRLDLAHAKICDLSPRKGCAWLVCS
jgi:Leucine-rich repeat (LRR) protein